MFNPLSTIPYQVKVWYENTECHSNIYIKPINRIIPDLTLITGTTPVCGSSYSNYSIANINADSYNWTILPESAGSVNTGQNTNSINILWNQTAVNATIKLEAQKCGVKYISNYPVSVINSPAVSITGDTTACTGHNSNFSITLNPNGIFNNVVWDFGDGISVNIPYTGLPSFSTSHIYNDPLTSNTTYKVTATVFGAGGCIMSSYAEHEIVVSPSPVIYLSPTNNLTLCDVSNIATSYIYSVNMQNGFAATDQIQWYKNNVPLLNETNSSINVQSYGQGSYFARVTNVFNCTMDTQTFLVQNNCTCLAPYNLIASAVNTSCGTILVNTTLIEGNPINVLWENTSFPGATIFQNSPYVFEAENIDPGSYNFALVASYTMFGSTICHSKKIIPFIIPYKAGLKYKINCNNGNYTVQLLDHSVYYSGTPIQNFSFTIDNGATWIPGNVSNSQLNIQLIPGVYQIGIKIESSGYPSCTHIETLSLPNMPDSNFTFTQNTCQGSAVKFYVNNPDPDSHYFWTFGIGVNNIQQNPVRVFNGFGLKQVTLTVTNKYGCTSTTSHFVNILQVNMDGYLIKSPLTTCEGGVTNLHFNLNTNFQEFPNSINWYLNNTNSSPIGITNYPNLDFSTTQSGYYIAYLTDSNGCEFYTTKAINVNTIPLPTVPIITGNTMVCQGSEISLSVPINNSIRYIWSLNGVIKPDWDNLSTINDESTEVGVKNYSVYAQISDGNGGYCNGPAATISVSILALPIKPQIGIDFIECNPYDVILIVNNEQFGVNYYWSNGIYGISTDLSHDGPIQVRAELNGCSITNQIDLPIDLETISWVFPTGCYESCNNNPLGYIIGPLGEYSEWKWLENGLGVSTGNETVQPFSNIVPTNDYQLYLNNGICEKTISNLSIEQINCKRCEISYYIKEVKCVPIDKFNCYYIITLITKNPYSDSYWANVTAPQNEGYFVNNTILIPPSLNVTTLYFYPINGFIGGNDIVIKFSADLIETKCEDILKISFPNCIKDNREAKIDSENTTIFFVSPNPSIDQTIIYYSLDLNLNDEKNSDEMTSDYVIEIFDMIGIKILTLPVVSKFGNQTLNTSDYAAGSYLVVLKENNKIIKNVKLIISTK